MKINIFISISILFLLSCNLSSDQSKNNVTQDTNYVERLSSYNEVTSSQKEKLKKVTKSIVKDTTAENNWKCNELFDLSFYNSFNEITKDNTASYFSIDSISNRKPINYFTESAFKIDDESILIILNVSFIGVCSNFYAFVVNCENTKSTSKYLFSNCDQSENDFPLKISNYKVDLSRKIILVETNFEFQNDSISREETVIHFAD